MINDAVKNGYLPAAPGRESAPVHSVVSTSSSSVTSTIESAPTQLETAAKMPAPEELQAAVKKLNDYVQNIRRTLSFSIEESTGRTIIKVYDAETDELIRQIPPEDTMKLADTLTGSDVNLLLNERA